VGGGGVVFWCGETCGKRETARASSVEFVLLLTESDWDERGGDHSCALGGVR